MRVFTALALFVSLAVTCPAGDWLTLNQQGLGAFKNREWAEALSDFQAAWPLAETPARQAATAGNIGSAFHVLARYGDALPWFQKALTLWQTLPDRTAETAETSLGLVDDYRATGDYQAAEQTIHTVLLLKLPGKYRGALLSVLGDLQREQSRKQEARATFEQALAVDGLAELDRIQCLLGLADIDRSMGNWPVARENANRAVAMARAAGNGKLESVGLRILGLTAIDSGDLAVAEPALRRSLAILQKEPDTPFRQLASAFNCLGVLYRMEGKYSMAEEAWQDALALDRKNSAADQPQTAVTMESLAELYSIEKRYREANDLAVTARDIMTAKFGPDSLPAAGALAKVGLVQQAEKRTEAAAASYEQALVTFRSKGLPADRNTIDVMDRYATVLATLHRNDEAKQLRQEIKTFRLR